MLVKIFLIEHELNRFKKVKREANYLLDLPSYEIYEILSERESDVEINE